MHIYMHTYNNTTGALCIYTCIHITICIYMYAHDKIHMHITICIRQRWGSNCILSASQKLCSVAHARESAARRCARQTKPDELLAAHEQDFVWCGRVASTAEVRDKTNITHSRTCVSHTLASRLCARDSVTNELIKSFHIYLFLTYEWVTTREWIIWMSYYTWMNHMNELLHVNESYEWVTTRECFGYAQVGALDLTNSCFRHFFPHELTNFWVCTSHVSCHMTHSYVEMCERQVRDKNCV